MPNQLYPQVNGSDSYHIVRHIGSVNIKSIENTKRVAINKATAATHELVAAVAGYKIKIVNLFIVSANDVAVTFKSATTALTGAMTVAKESNLSLQSGYPNYHLLETAAGEAFNMTLGGAVQVSGALAYILEK